MSEFFSILCRKTSRRGIQNINLRTHRNFLRNFLHFFSGEFFFFSFSEKQRSLSVIWQTFLARLSILHLKSRKKIFEENFLSGKLVFFLFFDNEWMFFSQLPKKYRWSCQNPIMHLQRKNLNKKKLFLEFETLIYTGERFKQKFPFGVILKIHRYRILKKQIQVFSKLCRCFCQNSILNLHTKL